MTSAVTTRFRAIPGIREARVSIFSTESRGQRTSARSGR